MAHAAIELGFAWPSDAQALALMSRDFIETGLGWGYRRERIARLIGDPEVVALVARHGQHAVGFAVMRFGDDHAHLVLVAVRPPHRRNGIARRMVAWLVDSAVVAGAVSVHVELRVANRSAYALYRSMGFSETVRIPGYYGGRETALRMIRVLRSFAARRSPGGRRGGPRVEISQAGRAGTKQDTVITAALSRSIADCVRQRGHSMMDRRTFLVGVAHSRLLVETFAARGRQPLSNVCCIGVLAGLIIASDLGARRWPARCPGSASSGSQRRALRAALRDLGYVEGENLVLEVRLAAGRLDLLPALAAELVAARVDVIAAASPPAIQAAKDASGTIPIVMAVTSVDPVNTRFVQPFAPRWPHHRRGDDAATRSPASDSRCSRRCFLAQPALPCCRRPIIRPARAR